MRIDILRNVNKKDGKMVKIVFFVKYCTWNYVHFCVKISHKRIRVCKRLMFFECSSDKHAYLIKKIKRKDLLKILSSLKILSKDRRCDSSRFSSRVLRLEPRLFASKSRGRLSLG